MGNVVVVVVAAVPINENLLKNRPPQFGVSEQFRSE